MPQAQHRPHHHIHPAASFGIHFLGVKQKINQLLIHLQGLSPCLTIDRTQVDHVLVFVVDIKKLMIVFQHSGGLGGMGFKGFRRVPRVTVHIRDGIKIGKVGLSLRLDLGVLLRTGRQGQCQQQRAAQRFTPF